MNTQELFAMKRAQQGMPRPMGQPSPGMAGGNQMLPMQQLQNQMVQPGAQQAFQQLMGNMQGGMGQQLAQRLPARPMPPTGPGGPPPSMWQPMPATPGMGIDRPVMGGPGFGGPEWGQQPGDATADQGLNGRLWAARQPGSPSWGGGRPGGDMGMVGFNRPPPPGTMPNPAWLAGLNMGRPPGMMPSYGMPAGKDPNFGMGGMSPNMPNYRPGGNFQPDMGRPWHGPPPNFGGGPISQLPYDLNQGTTSPVGQPTNLQRQYYDPRTGQMNTAW